MGLTGSGRPHTDEIGALERDQPPQTFQIPVVRGLVDSYRWLTVELRPIPDGHRNRSAGAINSPNRPEADTRQLDRIALSLSIREEK